MFAAPDSFDLAAFLANAGLGRSIVRLKPKQAFFSQGDPADSVFYLQKGRAKITVVSAVGKEATVTLLVPHDLDLPLREHKSEDVTCDTMHS